MAELIWFRCFIEGKHFPGVLLNEKGTVGFYTTRFVQAESPEQAELEAVALLLTWQLNRNSVILTA